MTDAAKKRNPNTCYLLALPAGWNYAVTMSGHDGQVNIRRDGDSGDYIIESRTSDGVARRVTEDDLGEAMRTAVKGIKALTKIAGQEKEIKAARAEALAALGEPEPTDSDPEPSPYLGPDPGPLKIRQAEHVEDHRGATQTV